MLTRVVPGAIELRVRVSPGASRSRVLGRYGDRLKVQVAAAPERGKANQALRDLLAGLLGIAASGIEIVQGSSSPDKVLRIYSDDSRRLESLASTIEAAADRGTQPGR